MKTVTSFMRTVLCIGLAVPSVGLTQNFILGASVHPAPGSPIVVSTRLAPTTTAPAWEGKIDRWLDFGSFNYGARYRSTFDTNGARTFDQGQQHLVADGKFKFDEQGRYGIGFHLSSGRYFNWSYADFIGGGQHQFVQDAEAKMTPYQLYIFNVLPPSSGFYNSGGGQLYLRQLFLAAELVHGIEFQFGGLAINHGVNSEATSYDDDGYMSGERVTVRRPKQAWLSEISYTRGYLGDLYTPNFFARGERLSRSNYWQILGRKDFGKRIAVSADYTYTTPEGAAFFLKTSREAILADVHQSKVIDQVRFEAYQRINAGEFAPGFPFPSAKGYAVTLSRNFKNRFAMDAGVADIDVDYITNLGVNVQALILGLTVNGDQYGVGRRYFVRPAIPLTRYASLVGNYSHVFDTNTAASSVDIWNNQALTAGVVFDLKKAIFPKSSIQ
jgi:hypothetical protein